MIDFAEDLRQTLVSLARENKALSDNLTAVQTRCTELLEEKRLLYKMCETLRHERNLAAESVANGFWLWSDTDDNWLDGLTNDALITMSAAQLRELIAERRARELEDQRATGDVLAGILGRERCVDGNVCLANDVALKIEVLEQQIHELSHDKACSEILERDQYEAISNLNARLREALASAEGSKR